MRKGGGLPSAPEERDVLNFSNGAWRSEAHYERLHFFGEDRRSACRKRLYLSGAIDEPHVDESLWSENTVVQCVQCYRRVARVQSTIKRMRGNESI